MTKKKCDLICSLCLTLKELTSEIGCPVGFSLPIVEHSSVFHLVLTIPGVEWDSVSLWEFQAVYWYGDGDFSSCLKWNHLCDFIIGASSQLQSMHNHLML